LRFGRKGKGRKDSKKNLEKAKKKLCCFASNKDANGGGTQPDVGRSKKKNKGEQKEGGSLNGGSVRVRVFCYRKPSID